MAFCRASSIRVMICADGKFSVRRDGCQSQVFGVIRIGDLEDVTVGSRCAHAHRVAVIHQGGQQAGETQWQGDGGLFCRSLDAFAYMSLPNIHLRSGPSPCLHQGSDAATCNTARESSVEAKGRTRDRLRKMVPERVAMV